MMAALTGLVAVVTGASTGIGAEVRNAPHGRERSVCRHPPRPADAGSGRAGPVRGRTRAAATAADPAPPVQLRAGGSVQAVARHRRCRLYLPRGRTTRSTP